MFYQLLSHYYISLNLTCIFNYCHINILSIQYALLIIVALLHICQFTMPCQLLSHLFILSIVMFVNHYCNIIYFVSLIYFAHYCSFMYFVS